RWGRGGPRMLLDDPRLLRDLLPAGSRLLGLDVGSKTVGTALSDTRLVIASPLETIRRRGRFRDDAAALLALIDRHGVGGVVIGLPLAMSGGDSPRATCWHWVTCRWRSGTSGCRPRRSPAR